MEKSIQNTRAHDTEPQPQPLHVLALVQVSSTCQAAHTNHTAAVKAHCVVQSRCCRWQITACIPVKCSMGAAAVTFTMYSCVQCTLSFAAQHLDDPSRCLYMYPCHVCSQHSKHTVSEGLYTQKVCQGPTHLATLM